MTIEIVNVTINTPVVEVVNVTVNPSGVQTVMVSVDDTATNTADILVLTDRVTTAEADIVALEMAAAATAGPWVDMTYIGAWTSADGGNSRPALQIREEGPYIRVRGTAVMPTGSYESQICNLPEWAAPFGSQIIPICSNSSDGSQNHFGSIRVKTGGLWASNEGGVSTNIVHYMEFRYLRKPPTYQAAPTAANNYVSVSPWLNYSPYSEWLVPSINIWNGQTTLHGLAGGGTVPASNIWNLFGSTQSGTRGGATEIVVGWGYAGGGTALTFRGDVSGATTVAGSLMETNTWISPARMEWVNNGNTSPARTTATLTNSWTNYGGGYQTAGYVKIDDVVFISGLVSRPDGFGGYNNNGSSVFTLPEGYRPAYTTRIPVFGTTLNAGDIGLNLCIYPDGTIKNDSGLWGNGSWLSLSGVNFSVTP